MEFMEEKTFPFEIKSIDEQGTFEGYAAIFGKPDDMGEVIEKGAFTKSLQERDFFPLCWYHDVRQPIGIVYLVEDEKGLKTKGELNLEVQAAREKNALMRQKAVRGLSFGFNTIKDLWDGGKRILKEVKLFEVSLCTFQMHPQALVTSVKQFAEQKPYPNEHSARIKNPNLFDETTFTRTHGGTIYGKIKVPSTIDIIWAKLKDHNKPEDNPHPQALRFPTDNWTVVQAKKWLEDNNVKYESFEAASKSLEGVIEFLEDPTFAETKVGKMISSANLKLINNAVQALVAILKKLEPSDDTQDGGKGILSPIIEELGKEDKPREHLFGETIEILEKK